jgi:broad specificity phosphatase PhoE
VADLLLIRHGQARYGEADYDRLSDRGHEQARRLGPELARRAPAIVFTGPLRRQIETYVSARAGASEAGLELPEPTIVPELAEYPAFELIRELMPRLVAEESRFAELRTADARTREAAFEMLIYRWGSGEWNANGLERVMAAAAGGQLVAAVTSAGPIGVAMGLAIGAVPDRMIRLSRVVQNASISQLRFRSQAWSSASAEAAAGSIGATDSAWPPGQVSMFAFNVTAHLPPELVTDR